MKHFFLFLLLAGFPLLTSCDVNDYDGGFIYIDSIGVANVDGSRFKMLAEGGNPQITPDSKKIVFTNIHNGIYSVNVDGSSLTCIYQKKPVNRLLLSPDGKRVAFTSDTLKTIYLINIDGSGFTQLYGSKYDKFILYFSNDGSKLYFIENNNFSSVDLNGNCKILSTDPAFSGYGKEPQISADESKIIYLMYTGVNPHLFLKDLKSQKKDSMLVDCDHIESYNMQPAKFISQSTFLYVYNHALHSFDLLSGEKKDYVSLPDKYYYYSQDGQKVLYGMGGLKICVANIDGTSETAVTVSSSATALNPYLLSPDNKLVIFSSRSQKYVQ